jgi:hypothetical protein
MHVEITCSLQEKEQMDTLVEELQQQLTRLPLQQRARYCSSMASSHNSFYNFGFTCRFAKAATKAASSALSEKVSRYD